MGQLPRIDFPPLARKLAAKFWPGPLTIILPKSLAVPPLVTSGLSTVGVRVPDHPLTQKLLRLADVPVAAPSANPFGRLRPTTAEHVRQQLGDRVEVILDGGPCRVGVESTIVQVQQDVATLLRPGGIPLEEIEALIGPVQRIEQSSQKNLVAPGMLDSYSNHAASTRLYAPVGEGNHLTRDGILAPYKDAGTLYVSGTSFAAPQVAGAYAVLREKFGAQAPLEELTTKLWASGHPLTDPKAPSTARQIDIPSALSSTE